MRRAPAPESPPRSFVPLQVEQRELSEELAPIAPRAGPGGRPYAAARVLVRLRSRPLGTVDVPLPADARALAAAVEARFGPDPLARAQAREPAAAPDRQPFVSVVVPTRDRPELLARCLDSVLACDYPRERFEVVVADNAPTDPRTRELVERDHGADGRVGYLLVERPGSASARNDGAARARGEVVAFVDDDAVADGRWLAELAAGFGVAVGVACVTGLVVPAELDTWAQQLFDEYGGFGAGFEDAVYDLGSHRPEDPLFPFAPGILGSGNNVAFCRAELLALGGYDECLGNGTPTRSGEDWELFLRLLRAGRTAVYRPAAIVHHRDRREYHELRAQIHDYGVGLAAALTRTVVHDPGAALELARRLPRAARHLLASDSAKNRNRSTGYPAELRRAELVGMARGPLAYARSRRGRGRSRLERG
ncbi:MAG TPA: glycosyltransferase [Thermoleophilaceae bacterium]